MQEIVFSGFNERTTSYKYMKRVWQRANPNAPSDSEDDDEEDNAAGVPDHISGVASSHGSD